MNRTARISISLPSSLAARVRKAARRERAALSAWVADAAERKLLLANARAAIVAYERAHGEITVEELARAERVWRA
jgi:hypothetical protein